MKIYIAGPMDGVGGNYNFPLFDYVAGKLRDRNHTVFSPAEAARELIGPLEVIRSLDKRELKEWRCRLLARESVWICLEAEGIAMLPGWEQSLGATAERAMAVACGKTVVELPHEVLLMDDRNDYFGEKL